nr:hypothetical protein [uncultured Methanoregula sp.]
MGRVHFWNFWSMVAILLAAVLILPAPACAADTDTADHHIAVRQAHLAWVALDTETRMNTALTYIGTRYNTDTTRMAMLLADLRAAEARIPSAQTDAALDSIISDIRGITRQFQNEAKAQMIVGQGSWNELTPKIELVVSGNPYIEEKKNLYWSTRKTGQLSDFDAWAGTAGAELTSLSAKGYDTTKAQRALDVTVAKRPELQAALEARDENQVSAAASLILGLSQEYVARAGEIGQQVPDDARIRSLLEQADRITGKADQLSSDTLRITLDLGAAEPALSSLKTDITNTKRLLAAGKLETARKNLPVLKKDLTDLAEGYRAIARSVNLPADLSEALNSMAVNLDNTADQMGA